MRIFSYEQFENLTGEKFSGEKAYKVQEVFNIDSQEVTLLQENYNSIVINYCSYLDIDVDNVTIIYTPHHLYKNAYLTLFVKNKDFPELYKKFNVIKAFA